MVYVLVDRGDNIVDRKDLSDDIGVRGARTFFVGRKQIGEKEFDELIKEHRKINDQKKQEAQLKASLSARRIWNEAQDASSSHPYLK